MWERLCALSEATEPGRISIKTAKRLRDCVAHGKRTSELSGEELEAAWKAGASSSAHRSLPSRWVRKASCCASLSAERHKLEPMEVLEECLVEPRRARGAEDRVALRREDGCDVMLNLPAHSARLVESINQQHRTASGHLLAQHGTCLLYTSPSPRD